MMTSPPDVKSPYLMEQDGILKISRDTDFWVAEL
jgi:hypothetical protein